MANRYKITEVVQDAFGNTISGAAYTITNINNGSLTVYTSETGSTAVTDFTSDDQGRIEAWVDAPDYNLTVTSGTDTYTQYIRLSRASDARSYNARPSSSASQNRSALNTVIANRVADGDALVQAGDGTHAMDSAISIATSQQIILEGRGMKSTTFQWSSDTGAGTFALDKTGTTSQQGHEIRNLRFLGPGGSVTPTPGTKPTATMDGINHGGDWKLKDCEVVGFRNGVTMAEDHSSVENCRIKNNFYGVFFPNNPIRTDNHYFKKCEITANALTSVGIGGDGARLAQTHFDHCHFGFSPWCFYRETHVSGGFCSELVLTNPTFEQYGNGVFCDETYAATAGASGSLAGLRIIMGICTQSDTYKYTAGGDGGTGSKVVIAPWNVRRIVGLRVFGGASVQGGFPAKLVAANTTLINCDTIDNSDLGDMSKLIEDLHTASKPAIIPASNYYGVRCQNFNDGTVAVQNECRFWKAGAAVAQFDLMQASASSAPQAVKYTTGIPIGVAQHTLGAAGIVPVAWTGRTPINSAANVIPSLTKVKPDTVNNGAVVAIAAASDLPKTGYSVAANSGGFTTCDLQQTL